MRRVGAIVGLVVVLAGCRVYGFGANNQRQLGVDTTSTNTNWSTVPIEPAGAYLDWAFVAASGFGGATCGIRDGGHIYCWGPNSGGRVGDGTALAVVSPKLIDSNSGWSTVSSAQYATCGIRSGRLYCWGESTGTGLPLVPHQIGSSTDWSTVSVGTFSACAIRNGGDLYCWGNNSSGQLGLGFGAVANLFDTSLPLPPPVSPTGGWTSVSVATATACGLRNGHSYCWGSDMYGAVGNGLGVPNAQTELTPVEVAGAGTTWTSLSAGENFTCGVKGGGLFCWGLGGANGSSTDRYAPTQVGTKADWTQVDAGTDHACGLRAGTLNCWGANGWGQLGLGTQDPHQLPAQVGTDTSWISVSSGHQYTEAVKT